MNEAKEIFIREYGIKSPDYQEQAELLEKYDKSWPLFRDFMRMQFLYYCDARSYLNRFITYLRDWELYKIGAAERYDNLTDFTLRDCWAMGAHELVKQSKHYPEYLEEGYSRDAKYFFTQQEIQVMTKELGNVFNYYQLDVEAKSFFGFDNQEVDTYTLLLVNPDGFAADYQRCRYASVPTKRIISNLFISCFYDRRLLYGESMPSEETFSRWLMLDRLLSNQIDNTITGISEAELNQRVRKNNYELYEEKQLHVKTKVAQILNTEDIKLSRRLKALKHKILNLKTDDMENKLRKTFIEPWPKDPETEITIENAKVNMPDKNRIWYIIHAGEKKLTRNEKKFKGIFLADIDYFREKYPNLLTADLKSFSKLAAELNKLLERNILEKKPLRGLTPLFKSAPEPNVNPENYILTDEELKLVEDFQLAKPNKFKIICKSIYAYLKCCSAFQRINHPTKWRLKQIFKIIGEIGLGTAALGFAAISVIMGLTLCPLGLLIASAVAGVALITLGIKKIVETKRQLKESNFQPEQVKDENIPNEEKQVQKENDIEQEKHQISQTADNPTQKNPEKKNNDNELHVAPTEKKEKEETI